jgi:uncharacterized protein YcfJ
MDKSMLTGILVGAGAVTAVAGVANYEVSHRQPSYAEVLKTEPLFQTIKTPYQVCKDAVVTRKAPVRDQDRIAGTAVGALVGGVLGHQIGAGSGRTVATIGGAAAGGYAGNRIQKNMQDSDTETTRRTRCKTEYESQEKVTGYRVTYRLGGEQSVVNMDYYPGDRIPVKDGKLVLTRAEPPSNEASSR